MHHTSAQAFGIYHCFWIQPASFSLSHCSLARFTMSRALFIALVALVLAANVQAKGEILNFM
jgi:hypothetical protein